MHNQTAAIICELLARLWWSAACHRQSQPGAANHQR